MEKQWYVLEMSGFSEDEAQEFLNEVFAVANWGKGRGMALSHLTEKGVADLKKYVFKQGVPE